MREQQPRTTEQIRCDLELRMNAGDSLVDSELSQTFVSDEISGNRLISQNISALDPTTTRKVFRTGGRVIPLHSEIIFPEAANSRRYIKIGRKITYSNMFEEY